MKQQQEKKRNRAKNADGVPVDSFKVGLAFANALNVLRPTQRGVTPTFPTTLNVYHIYFLYLWLTGLLTKLTDVHSIPTLTLVTGSQACEPHTLRRVRKNRISWVEYAIAYPLKDQLRYLWQPIPAALNRIFSYYLTEHSNALSLTQAQKTHLYLRLKRKWRTPSALKRQHMHRKDALYSYIEQEASIDPHLSTPAKRVLMSNALHHDNALSYQKLNSNQIRYDIFSAHNRYFKRLFLAINASEFQPLCNLRLPNSDKIITTLSEENKRPDYLNQAGSIVSYHLKISKGTHIYVPIAPIFLGSTRALAPSDITTFFHFLRQKLQTIPSNTASAQDLRDYYNQRTYELALLFILLTGTRPNHHISIERSLCFNLKKALISDKGRYRLIELCAYLQQAIQAYQGLQRTLFQALSPAVTASLTTLWYLIDDNHQAHHLTAKKLRLFMASQWQRCFSHSASNSTPKKVVPYQLRHSFAQHALMSIAPKLSTQQVDVLMGHSELGEHLGSAYDFHDSATMRQAVLERWPEQLNLTPISLLTCNEEKGRS